jgi:hypothetical protein
MKALLPFLLLLPASAQESDDPEALYRRMEEKLLKAKTILVKAQVKFEGDRRGESRTLLRIDRAPQRLRYDRMMIPGEMDRNAQVISDGQRVRSVGRNPVDEAVRPTFGQDSVRIFMLWGFPEGIERMDWYCGRGAPLIKAVLTDFKLIRREKIGTRSTACISLRKSVTCDWGSWSREMLLWIDEATFLPVRRVEARGGKCIHWTTTEDYEEVRFDEEMPAERFKLPD